MKKFILILSCLLMPTILIAAENIQLARMNPYIAGAIPSSSLACTIGSGDNWVNSDHSDFYGSSATEDQNFQEVANSAAKNICRIKLYLTNGGSTHNAVIKIKSSVGGTLYGTSDTTSIMGDTTDTQFTFEFTTPASVPANDFIVSYVAAGLANIRCAYTGSGGEYDKYFGGTSYKGTYGGLEKDQDFAMEIWYEQ